MGFALGQGAALLVAARGQGDASGLWRWMQDGGGWHGQHLAPAHDLSALALHPRLPVVYATAGEGAGRLLAWRIGADGAVPLADTGTGGVEPAHLAVDPAGRVLIVANYESGALTLWRLAPDGAVAGAPQVVQLEGRGPDPDRQAAAHPHQVLFGADGSVAVIDLGADRLRLFGLDAGRLRLVPLSAGCLPPGSGPRHGVMLEDGRMAVAGELGNVLLVGAGDDWQAVPATGLTRPGHARFARNYPGDIAAGPGGLVHLANRSLSTLATFDPGGPGGGPPRLVAEVACDVDWPQHLLVHGGHVLVAGWDSGRVVAHPLRGGVPGAVEPLFACAGACWLALLRG
ncbi:MAG: beta-propeller fold lactonase family protein [Rubellimicrobium sp.]|nr:beta-propeller fold lactonase family protein [Rubellimicrobium sp.]